MKLEGDIDWSLSTWEGSRRETLRRWARLPLEHVIAALEEMQVLNEALSELTGPGEKQSQPAADVAVQEQREGYRSEARELIMDILKYDLGVRVVRSKSLE